jgi:hypothetical protein
MKIFDFFTTNAACTELVLKYSSPSVTWTVRWEGRPDYPGVRSIEAKHRGTGNITKNHHSKLHGIIP